jgi:hypothetical protein
MATFEKQNKACSNIYLLDERLCIGKSLDTINANFSALDISINELSVYNDQWNDLYTLTISQSAKWYQAAANIDEYGAQWLNTCLLVQTLSSNWNKPIALYYNKMIEINSWYSKTNTEQDNLILPWLNTNFNPKNYLDQIIEVNIYLKESSELGFTFYRTYNENCSPNGGGGSVSCTGCPRPHRGCNHHGGRAGYGPCTNAYAACGASIATTGAKSAACVGSGAKQLSIGLERSATEINTATTVKIRYKNISNVWTRI